jgi:predicted nucleic-acid-binding protein
MIALDTNVLLRLLLSDDAAQSRKARQEIESVEAQGEAILLNDVVIAETVWTLRGKYNTTKPDLLRMLRAVFDTASFAFESRPILVDALARYELSPADFPDCLIAAKNAAAGCTHTATFDRAMRGLPAVKLL